MITNHPTVFGTQQRQNNNYIFLTLLSNSGNIPLKHTIPILQMKKLKLKGSTVCLRPR